MIGTNRKRMILAGVCAPAGGRAALAALFLFCGLIVGLATVGSAVSAPASTVPLTVKTAASGDVAFQVEIAASPAEQAKGLMFRRSLAANTGMLFVHETARPIHMWMRNTYISLDMIFVATDGKIVRIARNTEPFSEETISSGGAVTAVLEIAGGEAARLGIAAGDTVVHSHFTR